MVESSASSGSLWRSRPVQALVGVSTLGFTSFFLTYAALPYFAVDRGSSAGAAGSVTAAMLAVTVATQFGVPALTARWGLRRVLGAGLVALGAPAPFYLVHDALWWLVLTSMVRGAGFAVLTVLAATLTARVAPPDRHAEAVGIYGLAVAVPSLFALPAGVALTTSGHFPIIAIGAAVPIAALPLLRWLPAASATAGTGVESASPSRRSAMLATAPAGIALLVVTLAASGFATYIPIERPDGVLAAAALFAFGAAAALTRWRVGAFVHVRGGRRLLPAAMLVACGGGLVAAFGLHASGADAAIVAGCILYGAGYGVVQNLTLVAAFARAGPAHQTAASATWNAAFDTGSAVGAVGVGALHSAGLSVAAALAVSSILIVLTVPASASAWRH